MNGIYICGYDLTDLSEGVNKKIISQINLLEKRGIKITILDKKSVEYIEPGYVKDIFNALKGDSSLLMQKLLEKAITLIKNSKYDFVYIRKQLLDSSQIELLRLIKQYSEQIKIIMEIPTFPYDNEIKITRKVHLINDIKNRMLLASVVDRIVTFSKDETIFGVETIRIMNGASYAKIQRRKYEPHQGINCIAVAIFADWHGYDRFIDGMISEREIVQKNNIHLYLIGKGRELNKYSKKITKNHIEDYIHICGEKRGQELQRFYDIADIALDSMGRHRVNVFYNSTLKGKEYCAAGIPIVSGVETELDTIDKCTFYYRVPADESKINMTDIVRFYQKMYEDQNGDNLAEYIRDTTYKMFDLEYTFDPVVNYLEGE